MKPTHEELMRRWETREGLIQLGAHLQTDAFDAIKRSLPRVRDGIRLFERIEELLGDRGVRDAWAAPGERCLLLRDVDHPGWFLPHRLAYLRLDLAPEPVIHFPPIEYPAWFKPPVEPAADADADGDAEDPDEPDEPIVLNPGGRSGRLMLHEGPAYSDISWDETGMFHHHMLTSGDPLTFGKADQRPFHVDPFVRPAQLPPLSLLTRDDLRAQGHPIDELADMVLEMRPEAHDAGRCWCPVVEPGTVTGAWARGLWNIRVAEWEGRLPAEGGWAVIDAWNGAAVATGPSFDDAVARWQAQLQRVQPLPPVEAAPPVDTEAEDPPSSNATFDEEKGRATLEFGMRIEIHPPVILQWPAPRPENVPGIAVPLPALPAVPSVLADIGFTRVVRFFGEYGDTAFGFVRDDPFGFTMVGDDTLGNFDPATLDADLDRLDEQRQREAEEWGVFFHGRNPWREPSYPVCSSTYRVWDETGRLARLGDGGR